MVSDIERGYVMMVVQPSPVPLCVMPYSSVMVKVSADCPGPHFSVGDMFKVKGDYATFGDIVIVGVSPGKGYVKRVDE